MKRVFVYILLGLAFCLSGCEEKETPKSSVSKVETESIDSNTKLVVIGDSFSVERHLSFRIPKDWSVRFFDHWERPGMIFWGPSGMQMQVVVKEFYRSDLEEKVDDGVFEVEQRIYEDTLGQEPRRLNIHLVGVRNKVFKFAGKKITRYYEFVYDPTKVDSAMCERVIESLAVVDSVPENAERPFIIYSFTNGLFVPALRDFLCDGCSLLDSISPKKDSVKYFNCSFEDWSYRLISDSKTNGDTLSAVYIKNGRDESLPQCGSGLRLGDGMEIGTSRERLEHSSYKFKKNGNRWIYDRVEPIPSFLTDGDSTVRYTYADLFFVNDMVDHLYYSRYEKKFPHKKVLKKQKKAL